MCIRDRLCFVKNQLFGDETGTDGEVLLGSRIVILKVMALVETCAVTAPVPCDEMDAKPGGVGSQHCAVEVGQQAVVAGQEMCIRDRR